ncbi:hypothetical protein Tco_0896280 [Tanacetum coccineum]
MNLPDHRIKQRWRWRHLIPVESIHHPMLTLNVSKAHRSPTISTNPLETKKRKQTAEKSSSPKKSLKITIKQKKIVGKDDDDTKVRIETRSHKENTKFVDDDDVDKDKEMQSYDMGSLEIRNKETQTTIPTPPSSPRKILSSDKKIDQ